MARDHAVIHLTIWGDEEFRTLTPHAKLLYLALVSHPSLSYAGVADWRPGRLASLTGLEVEDVRWAAEQLSDSGYVVIDEGTEEILVRSFIRNDGLLKQPKMALAMAAAFSATASKGLRAAIVEEVRRLYAESPDLQSFTSKVTRSAEVLAQIMGQDIPANPTGNPFGNPSGKGKPNPSFNGQETLLDAEPNPSGMGIPPSPAPTPSLVETYVGTSPSVGGPGCAQHAAPRKKPDGTTRGTRIEEGWCPDAKVIAELRATYPTLGDDWWRLEHEKFVNHFAAQPGAKGLKRKWDLTFRNWIHTAVQRMTVAPSTRYPVQAPRHIDRANPDPSSIAPPMHDPFAVNGAKP